MIQTKPLSSLTSIDVNCDALSQSLKSHWPFYGNSLLRYVLAVKKTFFVFVDYPNPGAIRNFSGHSWKWNSGSGIAFRLSLALLHIFSHYFVPFVLLSVAGWNYSLLRPLVNSLQSVASCLSNFQQQFRFISSREDADWYSKCFSLRCCRSVVRWPAEDERNKRWLQTETGEGNINRGGEGKATSMQKSLEPFVQIRVTKLKYLRQFTSIVKVNEISPNRKQENERTQTTTWFQNYDAIIVRSDTKITGEVLASGAKGKLKVVGRAGVGVDNIDIDAATKNNVVVLK